MYNMNDIKSGVYTWKVKLLLRLIPIVMDEQVFAILGRVHTGISIDKVKK